MVPDLNGRSPEGRAADSLHNFFTYVAVRVVLSQLQAYNPEGYKELRAFTEKHPNGLKDGDKFCAALMRESPRHKALALRILEKVEHSNRQLMCEFLIETSRLE